MNTTYYLSQCLQAFSVPFVLSKQLIFQLLITFRAVLQVWRICENGRNCRQQAAGELRWPPCPPLWLCRMGLSSAGCFLGWCLLEIASSPCWDSHPFLGELPLAVRKYIFLTSLFLFLTLIPLFPALSLGSCWQFLSTSQAPNRKLCRSFCFWS